MSLLRNLAGGLRVLLGKQRAEREMNEELQAYLDATIEEKMRCGMSREEALRVARVETGSPATLKEAIRAVGWESRLEALCRDLRYGLRMLARNSGFTAVAVLTLALGIGANTAIFSVIDAVLLNPLPYQSASRLVMIWEQNPERGWFHNIASAANFVSWRNQNHVFTRMAAIDEPSYDVSGTGEPMEVQGEQVSANFFSLLGVRAALGRTFTPEEDQPGSARVVVLSDELWKQRYGGDPTLVGHTIKLNRIPYTVIGIMPPGFYFAPWDDRAQLWTAGLDLTQNGRTWHQYMCIARLKPGISFERAQAEMDTIAGRLAQQYPEQKGWGVQLINLHQQVVGNTRPALLVLLGAVGLVLVIACANVANLQLARIAGREKEIALRTALGAGRSRLIRQLLSESMLLAMAGGGLGLLLAGWGVQILVMLAPQDTPGLDHAGANLEVLAFTLAISAATGIAFGFAPALGASKVDLNKSLKEGTRGSPEGLRSQRARGLMVRSEFALALVLLVGAGLLFKSFVALSRVHLGFEPQNVLTMRVALLGPRYQDNRSRQVEFFRDLLRNVEPLPGVKSAAVIDGGGFPPDGGNGMDFLFDGRPTPPPNQTPDGSYRVISPDYFRTMGIALLRGRYFTEADNEHAARVTIINERLARDYWPGRDPIGHRIEFTGLGGKRPSWFTIVGVVKSIKNLGLEVAPRDETYVPYTQSPTWFTPRALVVRTSGDSTLLIAGLRHAVAALDKEQPISDVRTMDQIVDQAEAGHRFPMVLLAVFAALALILAGIGIYGVVSYGVRQRTHEIGIRMALGARTEDVLRLVVGQGLRLGVSGIGIGIAAALGLTRLMASMLYGVKPTDPVTFLIVSLALLGVAALSCYIPARRATKIDPITALRDE